MTGIETLLKCTHLGVRENVTAKSRRAPERASARLRCVIRYECARAQIRLGMNRS